MITSDVDNWSPIKQGEHSGFAIKGIIEQFSL